MTDSLQPQPKTHPASREMLPDDPLELHGFEIPGDPDLMLRLLVEEYARIGFGGQQIKALVCDPEYQAFSQLVRHFGRTALLERIDQILARCGVMRVRTKEVPPAEALVQIEPLPTATRHNDTPPTERAMSKPA